MDIVIQAPSLKWPQKNKLPIGSNTTLHIYIYLCIFFVVVLFFHESKVRFDPRPKLQTTVSQIICILELESTREMPAFPFPFLFFPLKYPSAPNSSAGYRRSRVGKSGLYGRVASTVYLLVTFAARPQPQHNYPTYSLNRNHAWQGPLATKVAVLRAIFCLRSSMAMAPWKDSHSFGHQHGFTLALEDSGLKKKKKKRLASVAGTKSVRGRWRWQIYGLVHMRSSRAAHLGTLGMSQFPQRTGI